MWIKTEIREQQVMSDNRTGESPCLGRSSGEILSMVRERDGLIRDFSDIIYRHRRIKTGNQVQCNKVKSNESSRIDLKLKY